MTAALRFEFPVVAKVDQGVMPLRALNVHTSTLASVAAAGTAPGNKLLTAEGHAAVAAIPAFHKDSGFIKKNHFAKQKADGA
jgi:hypothetical protein